MSELLREMESDTLYTFRVYESYGNNNIEIWWEEMSNKKELIHLFLYHGDSLQGGIHLCPKKLLNNLRNLLDTRAGNRLNNPTYEFEMEIDDFFINHQNEKIEVGWDECCKEIIVLTLYYGKKIYGFINFDSVRVEEFLSILRRLIKTNSTEEGSPAEALMGA